MLIPRDTTGNVLQVATPPLMSISQKRNSYGLKAVTTSVRFQKLTNEELIARKINLNRKKIKIPDLGENGSTQIGRALLQCICSLYFALYLR